MGGEYWNRYMLAQSEIEIIEKIPAARKNILNPRLNRANCCGRGLFTFRLPGCMVFVLNDLLTGFWSRDYHENISDMAVDR